MSCLLLLPAQRLQSTQKQPSVAAAFNLDANLSRQNAPGVMLVPVGSTDVRGNGTLREGCGT